MADGNGNKVVVLNTRERVLSTDANRAQSFYGQGVAELLRFMLDASSEEDRLGGGYEVMSTGSENPLRAYILNGLRPQPVNGTTSLLITPGVICIVDDPAPTADESPMAWVVDPGVSVVGTLTLPANGSGLTIIGVVECQRSTQVLEQDNRDVFNQSTGLFTPVLVNKVTAGRLIYRIRLGTPGAGFPGAAAGWTPLMVFNQPVAATTWDDVALMWDVRNMVNDRWNAPFNTPHTDAANWRGTGYTDLLTVGQSRLRAQVVVEYQGFRAGGLLGASDPNPATASFFDLKLVANQTGNFAGFSADSWWYVYAIFPFGLPRWQPYSSVAGTAPRRPCGQRGILAITNVAPNFTGIPAAVISTPTATGLIDTPSQSAVCLVAGRTDNPAAPLPVTMDGRAIFAGVPTGVTIFALVGTNSSPNYSEWTLVAGTDFPGNARAIYVNVSATFTASAIAELTFFGVVTVTGPDASTGVAYVSHEEGQKSFHVVAAGYDEGVCARVVLAPASPTSAARTYKLRWQYDAFVSAGAVTVTASALQILGWEIGP